MQAVIFDVPPAAPEPSTNPNARNRESGDQAATWTAKSLSVSPLTTVESDITSICPSTSKTSYTLPRSREVQTPTSF